MAFINLESIEINHKNNLNNKIGLKQQNPLELFEIEYNHGNFEDAYKICKDYPEIIDSLEGKKTIKMLEISIKINKILNEELAKWNYTH